ncbi:MAG: hypothetical protein PVH00_00655 [Gemmatimonadota bacterium]|jgi:hypothetical protein
MDEDILIIVISGLAVLIPVAGLTLRFALKPMVDSIARLLEVKNGASSVDLVDKRVQLLEQDLHSLRSEMQLLTDRTEFYERLSIPRQT